MTVICWLSRLIFNIYSFHPFDIQQSAHRHYQYISLTAVNRCPLRIINHCYGQLNRSEGRTNSWTGAIDVYVSNKPWPYSLYDSRKIYEGKYCLPSTNPDLNGEPVNMQILKDAGVRISCYSGKRDPIAPMGSCVASELWRQTGDGNVGICR
jgi:hypothetical protein